MELESGNYRITSKVSRFRWVTGRLPPNITLQVTDVTLSSRSYGALKEAVIARTVPCEDQRIRRLLQGVELGSQKPLELLRRVRHLRGAPFGDDLM